MDEFMLMLPDAWHPVRDWEDLYEVSNFARVRSLPRITRDGKRLYGRILRPAIGGNGYPMVNLCRDGGKTPRTVHSLVAEAFIGPRPDGEEVRHKDGVRAHCGAANLEYGTSSENQFDKVRHGTHHYSKRDRCKNDHLLAGDNLRLRLATDGSVKQRICLQCRRERVARITAAKPLLTVTCGCCGEQFEKPQTTGKNRRKYCSTACQDAMRKAQTAAWQKRQSA